jgi:hypothetical protein
MSVVPRAATITLAAVGALIMAAPAAAVTTITSSRITTPSTSPDYLLYNGDSPNTFAVSGTTDSTSPSTDKIDLLCFAGDGGGAVTLATNQSLSSNGSFSIPTTPLALTPSTPCRLRAVPAGTTDNGTAYAGPLLIVDHFQSFKLGTGPDNGVVYDFNATASNLAVGDEFASAGACNSTASDLLDSSYGVSSQVFSCSAALQSRNLDGAADTRSEVQVDGADAYAPSAAEQAFSNADSQPGLPSVSYQVTHNPSTGTTTITETDPFVRCPAGTVYPPTAVTCTSFTPTGVQLFRTTLVSGNRVTIVDSYSSTNGQAHPISLLYQSGADLSPISFGYQPYIGFEFPGQSAFAAHARGAAVTVPAGPGTILIKDLATDDGDPYSGQGAITYSIAPSQVQFISPASTGSSDLTMQYAATVPASGALTYTFIYSEDFNSAGVKAEGYGAEDAFLSPAVHISIPRNGQLTHTADSVVTGTATDLVGVVKLTVDKRSVNVNGDGSWSTAVTLRKGKNTFTAVATNAAGNSSTASVSITYKPIVCKVPKLAHKSVSSARAALKLAHCALGKTTHKVNTRVIAGEIVSSSPKAGTTHKAGTKVSVTLSSGPPPKHARRKLAKRP